METIPIVAGGAFVNWFLRRLEPVFARDVPVCGDFAVAEVDEEDGILGP